VADGNVAGVYNVRWIPDWREWRWMIGNEAETPDVVPAVELAQGFLAATAITARTLTAVTRAADP